MECTFNKGSLGKVFKKDVKVIGEYLVAFSVEDCDRIEKELFINGWVGYRNKKGSFML